MATELPSNGTVESSYTVKTGLARMLKGGVIMDVVNAEQVGNPYPSLISHLPPANHEDVRCAIADLTQQPG